MHKTRRKQKRTDALLKVYFRDSDRFADMINGILFNGKRVVTSDMLDDYDTDTSTYVETNSTKFTSLNRNRDIIKKINIDGDIGLIAIENQSHPDYQMLYRIREYDSYTCLIQYYYQQSLRNKTLLQIMTLVLYFGSKPWYGAKSFNELAKQPPILLREFMNYPMVPIVIMMNLDYHQFHHKDNYDLVKGLQLIYQSKDHTQTLKGMVVNKIVAFLLANFSDDEDLFKIVRLIKEDKIDMCEAIRQFKENNIMQGRNEGHNEGRIEGRLDILIEQLTFKFGVHSQDIVARLRTCDEKKLKEISLYIFKATSLQDIMELLTH